LALTAGDDYTVDKSFTMPTTMTDAAYLLFVVDYGAGQSETDETNNVQSVAINIHAPELTPQSFNAPAQAALGQTIDLSWIVRNMGDGAIAGDWYDVVYISEDATLDAEDTLLGGAWAGATQPFGPDDQYNKQVQLTIPDSVEGDRYLLLSVDHYDYRDETDETNNVLVSPISISAPDLIVDNTQAPAAAAWGEWIDLSWTVVNDGNGDAVTDWSDGVYLSTDQTLDGNDTLLGQEWIAQQTPLAPDGSYTIDRTVRLPGGIDGQAYLIFATDHLTDQPEGDETNNTAVVTIDLSAPDPEMRSADAPVAASLGQWIDVSWAVVNDGAGTVWGDWYDRVYVSADQTLDESDALVHSELTGTRTPLLPGGSYAADVSIRVPNTVATGDQYLLFVVDVVGGNQPDADLSNNVIARPINLDAADLEITAATAPAAGSWGEIFNVAWTVTNHGPGGAPASWADAIYLSADNVFDGSDTLLNYYWVSNATPLGAGQTYDAQRMVYIPTTTRGEQYLLIVTDYSDTQAETNPDNNVHAIEFNLGAADLSVASITTPAAALFGEQISVTWNVQNSGDGAVAT
jgi:subtilase family serine protease